MVFNVVILSIHGYFGQANVLGLPNTGGQIVYILDQVRALENEMLLKLKHQGLDIKPRILIVTRLIPDAKGTSCNQLLERVSETEHTSILRVPFRIEKGILRKCIWPYLEKFAEDAASEIYAELYGAPDFIIGNCSEGNLVASLLSYKMGVTQCTLAHALEKIKYPDSDLYWKKFDEKYHFSCQFTAVLLAMNNEDFIINGTYKKIAGPGNLSDPSKPMVFSMARLDCVKNITGLFEWYAKNNKIRELAKLVVVADYNNMARCDEYQLKQTALKMMNERGIFVQPSFYEAFGLTVVEAMTCGLPKSVTCYGGPAEIIEDGVSGFHIDPYLPNNAAVTMVNFFQECKKDTNYWVKISESGLKRIYERHMEDLL